MMHSAERPRLSARDWLVVIALLLAAVAAAVPGVHLLELWLSRPAAMLVSHGVGLVLLAAAVQQWRARSRDRASSR